MDTEPIAVGRPSSAFSAVLYLFLFWVGPLVRSRSFAALRAPAPEATGFHEVAGPGGRARPRPTPRWWLSRAEAWTRAGRWDLFGGLSIGRGEEADVRIDDKFASTIHCRIYSRGPSYYVEDMGSTNGTSIERQPLHFGVAALGPRRDENSATRSSTSRSTYRGALRCRSPSPKTPV